METDVAFDGRGGHRFAAGDAPYRERLQALAASDVVGACLVDWAAKHAAAGAGSWHRIYGKLRPKRSPWALLVYQAENGLTVQVRLTEPSDGTTVRAERAAVDPLGGLEILACAKDPALPGLPEVLESLEGARVVRYHPGNRCVVHGWSGGDARYVKVPSKDVDDQADARARWRASMSGELSFAVAEPHGWDERLSASWYGAVPGRSLGDCLGAQGTVLARQVGVSLGELAASSLRPARTDDAEAQLARTNRAVSRAALAVPALEPKLRGVFDGLARLRAQLPSRPLVPIHGAAHVGQWLVADTGRLGLVDFDRFAFGEPEFDLATFLVELWAVKDLPVDELRTALLDGFRSVAGDPDEELLALYVEHKRLHKVARMAASLDPDGPSRAAGLLAELHAAGAGS
jgi:phosphotransferase family enzyme